MQKKHLTLIGAVIFSAIAYFGLKAAPHSTATVSHDSFFSVKRVVDGDTLKLSDNQKVRLIGVDTPEFYYSDKLLRDVKRSRLDVNTIREFGRQASDFTKSLCKGKRVRLEFDAEKRDKYDRLLAYVYLEDGTFVNARILEEGYGQVMTIPPNVKYAEYFLKLQKKARENNKGLWALAQYEKLK